MSETSERSQRIYYFTFIWCVVAVAVGVISVLANVGAIARLAIAAFFLGLLVNMAALITLLLKK